MPVCRKCRAFSGKMADKQRYNIRMTRELELDVFIGAYLPVCKVEAPQSRPRGKEDTECQL